MASFDRAVALDIIRNGTEEDRIRLVDDIERAMRSQRFGLQWERGGSGAGSAFPTEEVVAKYSGHVPVPVYCGECSLSSAGDGQDSLDGGAGNLLLEGDNYAWLKILCQTHAGKVDVVFIDPPYNTGNNDFVYNDKFVGSDDSFSHSKWLTFMECRLQMARDLLADDGLLFITIDDNEMYYLKVLCDSIFGEEQFAACVPRKNVGSVTTKSDRELMKLCDYILIYRRSPASTFQKIAVGERKYPYEDERGRYYLVPLQDNGPHGTRTARPNLWYPIYRNDDGSLTYEDNGTEPYLPRKHKGDDGRWMWSKAKFDADGDLLTVSPKGVVSIKHYYDPSEDQTKWQRQRAWLEDAPNRLGTAEMKDIFGGTTPFSYPKPTALVRWCLGLHPKTDALVLDFFAGSGTTAQAVVDLNAEDGGSRRWILVTNNEGETDDDPSTGIMRSVTKPRIDTVLTGIRPDGTRYSDGTGDGYDFFTYDLSTVTRPSSYRQALALCARPAVMDGYVRIRYGVGKMSFSVDGNKARGTYATRSGSLSVSVLYGNLTEEYVASTVGGLGGDSRHVLVVPDELVDMAADVARDADGIEVVTYSNILPKSFLK